jgi:hypothetical protein
MAPKTNLIDDAIAVLEKNDRGKYTQPSDSLYPHQWLWDSCFIAIGLRHVDIHRAQTELKSLVKAQWSNGMMPNIVFRNEDKYRIDRDQWRSWLSPYAPDRVSTSGITQPPMLAEAVVQIGSKMAGPERRLWYKLMYPAIVDFHEWLYIERDPHKEGLVLQIHPWETGLDNTPPWMSELHEHLMPLWVRLVGKMRLQKVINFVRLDTKHLPPQQRTDAIDALSMFSAQRRLRRKAYSINKVLDHGLFSIEDLAFNSILIRANTHLETIAKSIRVQLPDELAMDMAKTRHALEELWDEADKQYYSRDFITHRLIKVPSIATLLPLYAGSISKERASGLVKLLENEHVFGTAYPVPSVPLSSTWFKPETYWQGPSWVNTNWMIIKGLQSYGFKDHAEALKESTLEMVDKSGFFEYFNPIKAGGLGSANFSWTAALVIDLIKG